jgi:hypothetical protein
MKKTLVALAALASVSAFAQTSVVIDGFIDRGYLATNSTLDTADTKTIASNSGTTTVGIKVNEDLGKGLTAGLSINTDWADLGGVSQSTNLPAQAGLFANSQSFAHITSKDMGTLRLGSPNTFMLTNQIAVSAPAFSTGVGSMYSSAYGSQNGLGTGTTGRGGTVDANAISTTASHAGARAIRIANNIQYSSPTFNGFSLHLGLAQPNNNATASGGYGNTVGQNETSLRYTNGPIDAMYSTIKYTIGSNGVTQAQTTAASGAITVPADANTAQTSTQTQLGAAYTVMPNLKVNFGSGTFSSSTATYQGSNKSYGATYTMGQIDFMLLMASTNDTATTNIDRKMTGMGLNYNLSKLTRAYIRTDNLNYNSNGTAAAGTSVKRTAVGISKSF